MAGCKKKVDTELEINFPGYFGQNVDYLEKLREFEELKLRQYLGENVDSSILAIEAYLVDMMKPKVFNPYDEDCVLIENDRRNEDLINSIEENGLSVHNATVFEFYNKIMYLEKRARQNRENKR